MKLGRGCLHAVVAALALLSACGADAGSKPEASASSDAGELAREVDAGAPAALQASLEVATTAGHVHGMSSMGTRAFLGIPYAAPPTGDKRWRAPEPATAWSGTREATSYGPTCTQLTFNNSAFDATSSEDCLSLNVWAPATQPSTPLPVMVWLHGGAYLLGSGGSPYNGEALVRDGNVIVVTVNYRLSELGYLVHPALTAEAKASNAPFANFGLLDQRLALQWVRDNIGAFGGDPANVTLFGESAGANSICLHMIAEGSRGLFHKAILQSGLCMKPFLTLLQAEAQGQRYAAAMGCSDPTSALSCLRQLPARQTPSYRITGPDNPPYPGGLFYTDPSVTFAMVPVIDGVVLQEQPEQAFAAGHIARLPVLHGVNTNEGSLFHQGVLGDTPPADATDYQRILQLRFGERAADVYAHVPDLNKFAEVTTAALFVCPARRMAGYFSAVGVPNFLYRFDLSVDSLLTQLRGLAFHSAELPYVFGNNYILGSVPAANQPTASLMRAYWTHFAATGDPNGPSTAASPWAPYTQTQSSFLNLASPVSLGSAWDPECATFWDGVAVLPP